MKAVILVAYASRYGSTREVATRISEVLRTQGFQVECRPMSTVSSLADYRTVVCGAPFYYGRWPRQARRFLSRFGPELVHRDVAVFGTGRVGDEQTEQQARAQLDQLLTRYDWLHPFTTAMFGGRWDPESLTGVHRLFLHLPASPLRGLPAADLRDWNAIEDWAARIARMVQSGAAQPESHESGPGHTRSGVPLSLIAEYAADQQRPEPRAAQPESHSKRPESHGKRLESHGNKE
ncbi:flavodoxin domain-containing protein [Nocardia seriolae]|uniref:Flavodoxin n=1 Tax=Nocardia seriolae TaxID=37332 RepID=A0ABC9YWG5_9NOCA|nr:flavodoxin domain-containing protein [Nocardia seriolae]WKY55372.1 flavodoxin domain-containing protein [Nocardia seriolae]BAW07677.1 conserved hypothetical protein [Nocardia seriolae]BEK89075.1 hypothetical protein NSERKGN1266_50260 [Nocardia seriolae]BEK95472.1 hypothetical protein NSER024013_33780 [Nocardia seriolae]GAM47835.1 flavodoxin [Nocardia seriolae]